ncbi:TPA: ParB/RepB/Spo0J family partition protein [Vibrio parahaemolyticus]|uniref:ParB/RepB/Spo0J family partition protein n=1 Tax=Vibrio parahaemolyticus TaxID=670 RepID=UPI00041553AB|nr:ParB/RepB/Spo0J family partition protein [Vibrio parahaemolyticus]EGR1145044.1 ParB/RepB/Spo0J family partition protein [Vibrio parahaemolyticus]MBE3722916.1 ParB/RepB/Spo0J family partition protein [Vibrio parahaemolyticus]MBE3953619.1 ParB/RepB/Spo0J family partition protein [Vibrio parahaemolyticus]MBE4199938.1 ParB/RepB/Spo0J family partition protein [Vibrio parahaemolyticus]MBE4484691.1 ParB/RepB/Spo0J family partition protein [Vibrio parahaemolyticus]
MTKSLRDRIKLSDLDNLLDESAVEIRDAAKVLAIPKDSLYSVEQVREEFNDESLLELCESLEENGQIQPVVVYPFDGKGYKIQEGERRWRATMLSDKLTHVECIVREKGDIFGQLIENIQREDLTPIELGKAFDQAKKKHNLDNRGLAKRLGKSDGYISKYLNVLKAPDFVLEAFQKGIIGDVESINELRKATIDNSERVREALESGEKLTRQDCVKLRTGELDSKVEVTPQPSEPEKAEKTQTTPVSKKPTANQKPTSICVMVNDRHGLVFASGKHSDKLTVLFDDGELEQVPVGEAQLVGYRV